MFSEKPVKSNVPLLNAGKVSPDLTTGSLDLPVAQNYQTQCLSNDSGGVVTRSRTKSKAIDDFRVALTDTPEAVSTNTANGKKRTASKPAGFQPGLTAARSFEHPGARHMPDIDNTALDGTRGLKKRKPVVNKKSHQCSVCGASFDRPAKLSRHSMTHTGERPFHCDDCDYCCSNRDNLLRHQERRHSEERPHECEICGKAFKVKGDVYQHQKFVHGNGQRQHCVSCCASYKSSALLNKHMKDKHPDLQRNTRSTNTGGAVISQSPLLINRPSTSGTGRNNLITEQRLNKLLDASNGIFPDPGESERSDRSRIDNFSDTDTVVDMDETSKHKKQEITVDSPGKRKYGISELLEEQTVNSGAVLSQSLSVIDQPSTSATDVDSMAEEDLDHVFDGYFNDLYSADWSYDRLNKSGHDDFFGLAVDPGADETGKYKKITVDSHGKREQGMSELLEKQTADASTVVSQSPSVMDDLMSEEGFGNMISRYTRDLLDSRISRHASH